MFASKLEQSKNNNDKINRNNRKIYLNLTVERKNLTMVVIYTENMCFMKINNFFLLKYKNSCFFFKYKKDCNIVNSFRYVS